MSNRNECKTENRGRTAGLETRGLEIIEQRMPVKYSRDNSLSSAQTHSANASPSLWQIGMQKLARLPVYLCR
jgi:hypothetical protein